jgi:hypothetical protein
MDEQKRKRRQEELRRIDTWLQKLHRDHPVLAWLLTLGLALGIFVAAMLLRAFLEWLGR